MFLNWLLVSRHLSVFLTEKSDLGQRINSDGKIVHVGVRRNLAWIILNYTCWFLILCERLCDSLRDNSNYTT